MGPSAAVIYFTVLLNTLNSRM